MVRLPLVFNAMLMLLYMSMLSGTAHAFEWSDLWRTPAQRAQSQLETGEYDALVDTAPDDNWAGVAQYRSGDYTAAAESFARAREQQLTAGNTQAARDALYNEANAHMYNQRFQQALEGYEQVLADDPEHADALHNRAIAEQAIELQQQEQQQQPGQQGEGESQESDESSEQQQSQQGDSSSGSDANEQSESDTSQEQDDGQEQDGSLSDDAEGDGNEANAESSESQSGDQTTEQDERDAAAALAASQENENNAAQEELQASAGRESDEPLSEDEQATEQWLRRIPDDPAGLLRSKLRRSHDNEYPEVRDSARPW